jgi:hypothetical protein
VLGLQDGKQLHDTMGAAACQAGAAAAAVGTAAAGLALMLLAPLQYRSCGGW